MKKLYVMLAAALLLALLSGCAFTEKLAQLDLPEPPGKETATPAPDPEEAAAEQARQEELNARRAEAIARSEELRQQYFYDEAIAALSDEEIVNEQLEAELDRIEEELEKTLEQEKEALKNKAKDKREKNAEKLEKHREKAERDKEELAKKIKEWREAD